MRVRCEVDYVELDGDYATVESVCVTCTRCGHETESYGTSAASVRRCLALLREECPNDEHNYYLDPTAEPERKSPVEAAYDRGYADGRAAAARERPSANGMPFNAAQIKALVTLTHPDRHPPERFELANKATAALLGLLAKETKQ